jgi:hypothetical protein
MCCLPKQGCHHNRKRSDSLALQWRWLDTLQLEMYKGSFMNAVPTAHMPLSMAELQLLFLGR